MDKYEWMMDQIVYFFKEEGREATWDHFTDDDIPYADDDIYWLRISDGPDFFGFWTKSITRSELDGCKRIKDLNILATEAYLEFINALYDVTQTKEVKNEVTRDPVTYNKWKNAHFNGEVDN